MNNDPEQDPQQASQPDPTQCYANHHMTPEEYGYWNLFRSLSHATERLEFGAEQIKDSFWKPTTEEQAAADAKPKAATWKPGDKSKRRQELEPKVVGEDRPGLIRKALEKRGWLKCTRPANTERMPDGKFAPPEYEVLSHEQWAKKHPGACKKRLALNAVEKPKKETGVTVGKKNRPYTYPRGVHAYGRRNEFEQVKPCDIKETPSVGVSTGGTRLPSVIDVPMNHDSCCVTGIQGLKDSRSVTPTDGVINFTQSAPPEGPPQVVYDPTFDGSVMDDNGPFFCWRCNQENSELMPDYLCTQCQNLVTAGLLKRPRTDAEGRAHMIYILDSKLFKPQRLEVYQQTTGIERTWILESGTDYAKEYREMEAEDEAQEQNCGEGQ